VSSPARQGGVREILQFGSSEGAELLLCRSFGPLPLLQIDTPASRPGLHNAGPNGPHRIFSHDRRVHRDLSDLCIYAVTTKETHEEQNTATLGLIWWLGRKEGAW